jgi:AraC-like DNA-binding protein
MLVCAFWTLMLSIDMREHGDRGCHRALWWWSMVSTLLYLGYFVFYNGDRALIPYFKTLQVACNVAVFPLYLRYLSLLTEGRVARWVMDLIWWPPLLLGLSVGVLYTLLTPAERDQFITTYLFGNCYVGLQGVVRLLALMHSVGKVVFVVGLGLTLWQGVVKVRRYNRLVDSIYSDTARRRLYGIPLILSLMLATGVVSFVANMVGHHVFVGNVWLLVVPFVVFSALLFALAYCGYRQRFSFVDIPRDEPCQPCAAAEAVWSERREQLELLVKGSQLYLDSDLTVDTVAHRLGTNRRYVQQTLNEEMGMSFSEYINRLRIAHAERLLAEHPELTMEDVAARSGYAVGSTFYRNFSKYRKS